MSTDRGAVLLSTARTPVAEAYRGAFADTPGPALAGAAIAAALDRAHLSPEEVQDVLLGCALPEGATGFNVARQASLRAGLPVTVPGMTIDRQCSSGLMAIAAAARAVTHGELHVAIAGGLESVSLVQDEHANTHRARDPWLEQRQPALYLPMLHTAEIVAERYTVSRTRQDKFALLSHKRAAAAQADGVFDPEIMPLEGLDRDQGVRSAITLKALAGLRPVLADSPAFPEPTVSAGNASQLSASSSACVIAPRSYARAHGIEPLGTCRGAIVIGCGPEEMGIGPVAAIPALLEAHGLTINDIDLWELDEAFASQAVYCRDALGIDPELFNINVGAIALGHPDGMTGSRLARPRAARSSAPPSATRRRVNVHRRWHGCRGAVRGRRMNGLPGRPRTYPAKAQTVRRELVKGGGGRIEIGRADVDAIAWLTPNRQRIQVGSAQASTRPTADTIANSLRARSLFSAVAAENSSCAGPPTGLNNDRRRVRWQGAWPGRLPARVTGTLVDTAVSPLQLRRPTEQGFGERTRRQALQLRGLAPASWVGNRSD